MKKLMFAAMMCVAAMSAKAQVITSETVKNVYEAVSNQTESDFAFNAEMTGKDITTMYVYKKSTDRKGNVSLKPHLKYEYTYAPDGRLVSRVTYRTIDGKDNYICASRYDYTLNDSSYSAEYSRFNHEKNDFDKPVDKIVYSLMPGDSVNHVSSYHRNSPFAHYKLVSEAAVINQPMLFAKK